MRIAVVITGLLWLAVTLVPVHAHKKTKTICYTDSDGKYQCEKVPVSHGHRVSTGVRG